jgi:Zn-dependent protease with chaperone function
MVIFGSLLLYFTNNASFLLSFGFHQESFYVSFALFTFFYSNSLDVFIRVLMRKHTQYLEKDADMYAVERGFGVVL